MASRSSVPASSFRVGRPGRKRPAIAACFPAQKLSSNVAESTTSTAASSSAPVSNFPCASHSVPSHPRALDTATDANPPRQMEEERVSSSIEPSLVGPSSSSGETSLLEDSCVSSAALEGPDRQCIADTPLSSISEASTGLENQGIQTDCLETINKTKIESTTSKLGHSLQESADSESHKSSVSLTAPPANNFPSSAFRSPAFFTILRRYLPLTVSRLQQSGGDDSVAEKSQKSLKEWLDEPDDRTDPSLECETDRSCVFSKPPDSTKRSGCSSSSVRPIDVEISKRSLSTVSQATASSLKTRTKSTHSLEGYLPGKPSKKRRRELSTSESSSATVDGTKTAGKVDKAKATKRPSPNAFVSLRIRSPSIRRGLEEVQNSMVEKDNDVKSVLTSLDKLHVTLSIIRLESREEEERAVLALQEATQELNVKLGLDKEPLILNVTGLASFGKNVVFAEIVQKEELRKLADIVCAVFEAHGFQDLGKEDFNPHLTIAKMSRAQRGSGGRGWRRRRRQEKSLNGISEELYVEFKDREFGIEKVTGIELLSMTHPPARDHYYHCFQQCSFQEMGTQQKTFTSQEEH